MALPGTSQKMLKFSSKGREKPKKEKETEGKETGSRESMRERKGVEWSGILGRKKDVCKKKQQCLACNQEETIFF